ncbi:MAG: hypothetical protein ACRDVF_04210 [Microbacterium sp.]|uniref:hypothetical protein n=1 Tax=Microbacterium sp. TaxID=51671 RepID=UPI003D6E1653
MSIPSTTTEIPPIVRSLAAGATLTPVWLNGIGGLTFRTDDGRYFGAGWEDTLIEAYGIAPDRDRLEYYRRLWNET